MKRVEILPLIGGSLLFFLVSLGGCAHVPKAFKGATPKYIELGEYETGEGWSVTLHKKEEPNLKTSVILHAAAIDQGIYGATLKIYLEAEDPNGDMAKIVTTVDQVAYGYYPPDFIILKPGYGKHFKGYIDWNTWSTHATSMPDGIYVTARVSVLDKKGVSSNEFVFRFTFQSGVVAPPKPPEPFNQEGLPKVGNVFIDLYNPYLMGGGGDGGNMR